MPLQPVSEPSIDQILTRFESFRIIHTVVPPATQVKLLRDTQPIE